MPRYDIQSYISSTNFTLTFPAATNGKKKLVYLSDGNSVQSISDQTVRADDCVDIRVTTAVSTPISYDATGAVSNIAATLTPVTNVHVSGGQQVSTKSLRIEPSTRRRVITTSNSLAFTMTNKNNISFTPTAPIYLHLIIFVL